MQTRWLISLFLLLGGIAIGLSLGGPEPTTNPVSGNQQAASEVATARTDTIDPSLLSTGLDDLRWRLQQEIEARQALQQQFDELRRQIAAIETSRSLADTGNPDDIAAVGSEPASEPQNWFNQQALLDSGMDDMQAGELKRFFEQLELERLNLRHQSDRENWTRQELREALRAIDTREDELRDQLSESAYDAYLYASGQTNRITVTSVLESAQAGTAGIRSGDHIIRYDNRRIYNWSDLRAATSAGSVGDSVTLEIERGGRRIEFYLARGPLGVRTNSLSVAP